MHNILKENRKNLVNIRKRQVKSPQDLGTFLIFAFRVKAEMIYVVTLSWALSISICVQNV